MNIKALIPMTILATLAIAGTAYANPSTASATCQGGIVYEGHDYPSSGNTVTVKIDGNTVAGYPKTFGPATSGTVPFPDKTSGHTWAVIWDRYNGTNGDRTQSGTVAACVVPPSTTVVVTTTVPPTTSVPDATTTVVTEPATTTSIVDIGTPPVPTTIVTPSSISDVLSLTPADPVLPTTGLDGGVLVIAAILVIGGVFLVRRGRRVR